MKTYIYVLFLSILICSSCNTTPKNKFENQSLYENVDGPSKWVPDSLVTYEEIAKYLTEPFSTDDEKIRAIHIWITHNIKYDISKSNETYQHGSEEEILIKILKDRGGVCFHYSLLFHYMCKSVGIDSYYISGYTLENNGEIADVSHAWNGVVIDSSYYMVDNTWAAGYQRDGNDVHEFREGYFLVDPRDFIKTHMPFDYLWQFLDNPITHEEFKKKNYSKLGEKGEFSFRDSIMRHKKLDSLTAFLEVNKRMERTAVKNDLIVDELQGNNQWIELLRYKKWLDKRKDLNITLNLISKEANKTIDLNNRFITFTYKNTPVTKVDEEVMRQLIFKAVKHYRRTISLLEKSKKSLADLVYLGSKKEYVVYCTKEKKRMKRFIGKIEYKMRQDIKPSLKLNALYADIELK